MKKFLTVLCLCVVSNVAFGADDDCVESPYDGKIYCCNVREKNLPDGAINKSWGEVIPWDKYYGTVRKCVGGKMTNDTFGGEVGGVAPNLWGAKIRKEASKYHIAWYTKFDGTYWYEPTCSNENYGDFSTRYDMDTGGCRFEGLLDVGDKFYKCGEFSVDNAEKYITEVTGKSVYFKSAGEFIKRSPDAYGQYVIFRCSRVWTGVPFCTESDLPTDAELQSGVLDHLSDGWLMLTDTGNKISLQGYDWGYDHEGYREEYNYLACWTRGTAADVKSVEANKKTTQDGENKYNYKSCSSDSDCTGINNTVRPYLHSTAWHCAWQSAGVRVCTATACESGWTPINGYCQEDKTAQTSQSENKNANSVSNIKTETKAGTKKPCTDLDNMDSNCKCIVAGTVERNGTCVCSDSNKVIKNGKCEWTAKYVAGLESDLDSKFNGLTATIGGFEKNVWRDENGEFNTARLASDSIAGVVLGTVGGIVTANLVKKAQVKQGFEDIGCYIGGQSVAGYGDEFNVGR